MARTVVITRLLAQRFGYTQSIAMAPKRGGEHLAVPQLASAPRTGSSVLAPGSSVPAPSAWTGSSVPAPRRGQAQDSLPEAHGQAHDSLPQAQGQAQESLPGGLRSLQQALARLRLTNPEEARRIREAETLVKTGNQSEIRALCTPDAGWGVSLRVSGQEKPQAELQK